MPRFAANLSFLFQDLAFLDRFAAAARAGFSGVEFMFPYEHDTAAIKSALSANGLELVLFNLPPGDWAGGDRGLAAVGGRETEFEAGVVCAIDIARALGCTQLHAMAGLDAQGANTATLTANLKRAAALAAPAGIDILIEPINTRDMPGYFLSRTQQARDVIAAAGAPNLGLQFDCYHRHVMEGDVMAALGEFAPLIKHIQIASPPDRGEPGAGSLDYRELFAAIDAMGHRGWVGCEYKPRGDTLAGLAWVEQCGVQLG